MWMLGIELTSSGRPAYFLFLLFAIIMIASGVRG